MINEYVKIHNIWHIYVDGDDTLCGIDINWFRKDEPRVEGVCHATEIPDLACIDCAMIEEINYQLC